MCCACRRSRTTFRIRALRAAPARTSSLRSPRCCPDSRRSDGVAVDHPAEGGRRRRFGNMILSRLPVRQAYRHLLPSPIDPGMNGMPRIAVEACVERAVRRRARDHHASRVLLATCSARAQIESAARDPRRRARPCARGHDRRHDTAGPFHTYLRPASTIVTGDFNLEPDDPLHARMGAPFDDGTPRLVDAWEALHPGVPHPGTFKLYEKDYPDQPELHCDFIFVSEDLVPRVSRRSRRPRHAGGGPSAGHPDARLSSSRQVEVRWRSTAGASSRAASP